MADRPLRVLVIGNLPPHVLGGAEMQVARLVEAWSNSGTHVEIAGHRIPDGEQLLGSHRIRTHSLPAWRMLGRAGRALGYLSGLWRLTGRAQVEFDVVYCRGLADGALGLSLLTALGRCRWPIVAVPINAGGAGDAHFLESVPGWRFWRRYINRHVAAINLINAEIAGDLDRIGITRPPRSFIPNGIPLQPMPVRAAARLERQLAWTGRFEPQKGLDLLLEALAGCRRKGAKFRLVLYGEGRLGPELERQSKRLGLSDIVTFAGSLPSGEVRDRLRDADVFVLPSRYEGMSNSALEAMEAGLPVLCTRCGGVDSAVEQGAGWVCAPGDVKALEAALHRVFVTDEKVLLGMGLRARELVETRFAMEEVANSNLRLLASVATGAERR